MIKLLFRIALFFIGVALLLDIGLPTRTETLHVDQHSSNVDTSVDRNGQRANDTSYKLHFVGRHVSTCSVGYQTYGRLKDGDTVDVKTTKISRNCILITQGGDVIDSDKHWKIIALVMGCLTIATALGAFKDGDGVVSI